MSLQVLYQKHGLLLTFKPPSICSDHHDNDRLPAMEKIVPKHFPNYILAHRIDKWTSGILVFADRNGKIENLPAYSWLMNNWHNKVSKTYLAIIQMPHWEVNFCAQPLKDDPEAIEKKCTTAFRVLQGNADGLALVQCELTKGGRKHQIRKHLSLLGSPIIGDWQYGGQRSNNRPGQLLHAWKLAINFIDGKKEFKAPLPNDFKSFDFEWNQVDKNSLPITVYD